MKLETISCYSKGGSSPEIVYPLSDYSTGFQVSQEYLDNRAIMAGKKATLEVLGSGNILSYHIDEALYSVKTGTISLTDFFNAISTGFSVKICSLRKEVRDGKHYRIAELKSLNRISIALKKGRETEYAGIKIPAREFSFKAKDISSKVIEKEPANQQTGKLANLKRKQISPDSEEIVYRGPFKPYVK